MTTYYKAVRPDGTDFHSGTVRWVPEDGDIPAEGWLVTHPTATTIGPAADKYLSVSTVAANCTGMRWPCRLLAVEEVGDVSTPDPSQMPNKRAAVAWRVVGELPAHEALGPQGAEVIAIIDRARRLTPDEAHVLSSAWWGTPRWVWNAAPDVVWYAAQDAGRNAAWYAVRNAAWHAAGYAVGYAARDAVRDAVRYAALAVLVRDLINPEMYDQFTGPWRSMIGEVEA